MTPKKVLTNNIVFDGKIIARTNEIVYVLDPSFEDLPGSALVETVDRRVSFAVSPEELREWNKERQYVGGGVFVDFIGENVVRIGTGTFFQILADERLLLQAIIANQDENNKEKIS